MTTTMEQSKRQMPAVSGGAVVVRDGAWVRVEAPVAAGIAQVGAPGLWKHPIGGDGAAMAFEVPCAVLEEGGDEFADGAGACASLYACLNWAQALLAEGELAAWEPPAEVEGAPEPEVLSIVSGGVARQGALVRRAGRLALRCVLGDVPVGLSPSRRQLLDALLLDASRRVRMVRVGWGSGGSQCVVEADLTGVPAPLAGPLARYAARAVSVAAHWLAEPVATVLDSRSFSSLDAFFCAAQSRRKEFL